MLAMKRIKKIKNKIAKMQGENINSNFIFDYLNLYLAHIYFNSFDFIFLVLLNKLSYFFPAATLQNQIIGTPG